MTRYKTVSYLRLSNKNTFFYYQCRDEIFNLKIKQVTSQLIQLSVMTVKSYLVLVRNFYLIQVHIEKFFFSFQAAFLLVGVASTQKFIPGKKIARGGRIAKTAADLCTGSSTRGKTYCNGEPDSSQCDATGFVVS